MTKLKIDIDKADYYASIIYIINHPLRLKIIELFEPEGTKFSVEEISKVLNINRVTTTHHLNYLKEKRIIGSRSEGKCKVYYLKLDELLKIIKLADGISAVN